MRAECCLIGPCGGGDGDGDGARYMRGGMIAVVLFGRIWVSGLSLLLGWLKNRCFRRLMGSELALALRGYKYEMVLLYSDCLKKDIMEFMNPQRLSWALIEASQSSIVL